MRTAFKSGFLVVTTGNPFFKRIFAMPRPKNVVPNKLAHLSGQDRVFLDGNYYYLGLSGSEEEQVKYDSLVAIYLATGRKMPHGVRAHQAAKAPTVAHVTEAFRRNSTPSTSTVPTKADATETSAMNGTTTLGISRLRNSVLSSWNHSGSYSRQAESPAGRSTAKSKASSESSNMLSVVN